jgi:ribose 5-phosphate isomerase B
MKVVIASDHAGVAMKEAIILHLKESGTKVEDLGPVTEERVDYPDFAGKVAALVSSGEFTRGVLVCGSGVGMAIAANKYPGCRAVVIHHPWEAEMSRRHNNANIACFGQRSMGVAVVLSSLDVFMRTEFDGGHHEARVAKIEKA